MELHLVPMGVISELAPQNKPWPLSGRLACGLVRALLASTCDFDSMLNIFGNDGVLGNVFHCIFSKWHSVADVLKVAIRNYKWLCCKVTEIEKTCDHSCWLWKVSVGLKQEWSSQAVCNMSSSLYHLQSQHFSNYMFGASCQEHNFENLCKFSRYVLVKILAYFLQIMPNV